MIHFQELHSKSENLSHILRIKLQRNLMIHYMETWKMLPFMSSKYHSNSDNSYPTTISKPYYFVSLQSIKNQ